MNRWVKLSPIAFNWSNNKLFRCSPCSIYGRWAGRRINVPTPSITSTAYPALRKTGSGRSSSQAAFPSLRPLSCDLSLSSLWLSTWWNSLSASRRVCGSSLPKHWPHGGTSTTEFWASSQRCTSESPVPSSNTSIFFQSNRHGTSGKLTRELFPRFCSRCSRFFANSLFLNSHRCVKSCPLNKTTPDFP